MNWDPDDPPTLMKQRMMARAKLRRIYREGRRYRALYRSEWIDRMLAQLRAEYRATWEWKRELEARWNAGQR